MQKDVWITIDGTHRQDGVQTEPVHTAVRGRYFQKNGRHYLLFEEIPEGQKQTVKSVIRFDDAVIEVTRRGGTETRMRFEKDIPCPTDYRTPMGALELLTLADHVGLVEEEERIQVETSYQLFAGGTKIQDSLVRITAVPYDGQE